MTTEKRNARAKAKAKAARIERTAPQGVGFPDDVKMLNTTPAFIYNTDLIARVTYLGNRSEKKDAAITAAAKASGGVAIRRTWSSTGTRELFFAFAAGKWTDRVMGEFSELSGRAVRLEKDPFPRAHLADDKALWAVSELRHQVTGEVLIVTSRDDKEPVAA